MRTSASQLLRAGHDCHRPLVVDWPWHRCAGLTAGCGHGIGRPGQTERGVGGLQHRNQSGPCHRYGACRSILIAALTTSFLASVSENPNIPSSVKEQANIQLAAGIPFMSDADLHTALDNAGVSPDVATAAEEATTRHAWTDSAATSPLWRWSRYADSSLPARSRRRRRRSRETSTRSVSRHRLHVRGCQPLAGRGSTALTPLTAVCTAYATHHSSCSLHRPIELANR
jgi:hypothetical protein